MNKFSLKYTLRPTFLWLCLIFFAAVRPSFAGQKVNNTSSSEDCILKTIASQPLETTVKLDEKPQKLSIFTRYAFEEKTSKKGTKYILASEVSGIVFDDFPQVYNNFLKKRVGPSSRCDKLEIGKLQVSVNKDGSASGYFVGRYEDRWCFHLKFFDSSPGETDRNMFVLYSSKGITGAQNTFIPIVKNGHFKVIVESTYQPIEDPSIFGWGEWTLTSLYKEPLDGFLSEASFTSIVDSLLPEQGKKKKKSGFNLATVGFMQNNEKKIQLTFLSQRFMSRKAACSLRSSLLKSSNWSEQ